MPKLIVRHVAGFINQDAWRVTFSDGSVRSISGMALVANFPRHCDDGNHTRSIMEAWAEAPELFEQLDGAAHV